MNVINGTPWLTWSDLALYVRDWLIKEGYVYMGIFEFCDNSQLGIKFNDDDNAIFVDYEVYKDGEEPDPLRGHKIYFDSDEALEIIEQSIRYKKALIGGIFYEPIKK